MGCTCSKGRNAIDESLNEIIEDAKLSHIFPEEYLQIIKKAVKSKKDLNDKFNFQTEIIEVALKSTNLFLQITFLKNTLVNLTEERAKSLLTLSLLFLCKFNSLENLKKNFAELFSLIKNQIQGLEDIPNKNNFCLLQKIIEFYATLVSKHLLDVYVFSLSEVKREQKEQISEYNLIFGSEAIRLFTESLFEPYKPNSFEADKFFDENYSLLEPNFLREKLRETFIKNETAIRSNNKIVSANRATVAKANSSLNGTYDLVSAGNPNLRSNKNYASNRSPILDFENSYTNPYEKKDLVESAKRSLNENNTKSTEESLDSRVDRYLREKGLISNCLGSSARNTFNSNLESSKVEETRPTAVFGAETNVNKNKNLVNNLLNEKDFLKKAPLAENNIELDINKVSANDKIKHEDLVSPAKDFELRKNYSTNIQSDNIIKNNEPEKKFAIEEQIFKINSPSIDNKSESLAESEFNILLKSRENNPNHSLKNILYGDDNKEKEIEKFSSPVTIDKFNIDLNSNEKQNSVNKNQIDDVFGFFNKEDSQPTNNLNTINNNYFNNNHVLNLKEPVIPSSASDKNNLLDFDFTSNKNTDYNNNNIVKNKINIEEEYKPEEQFLKRGLIDVLKSNSLEESRNQVEKPLENAYNPLDDQEDKQLQSEPNYSKSDSNPNNNIYNIKENNNYNNNNNYNHENNNEDYTNNENEIQNNNININNNNFINEYIQNENENYNPLTEEEETFSIEDFREEALRFNNFKRLLHSAEGLNPSEELENRAQEWAEYLAEKETLENRNLVIESEEVGESLACISYSLNGEKLIEEWYSQIEKYNFDNPRKKNSTANFTQMVWKGTSFVGFGAKRSQSGYYFAVAFYYPIGNLEGLYEENVLPVDQNIINQINEMNQANENENEDEEEILNEDQQQ